MPTDAAWRAGLNFVRVAVRGEGLLNVFIGQIRLMKDNFEIL